MINYFRLSDPEILPPIVAPEAEANADRSPWTLFDVLLTAAFTMFALLVAAGVAVGIAHFIPSLRHASPKELGTNLGILLGSQLGGYLAMLGFIILLVRHRSPLPFGEAILWRPPRNALPFVALGIALAVFVEFVSKFLPIPKTLPIDQYFRSSQSAWLMAAFAVLIAPVFEELFFRGLLYPALRRHLNVAFSLVITAFFFALLHQGQLAHAWAPLLMLFIVGAVLTGVRARTRSVASSYIVHTTYNATLFVLLFVATDGFRHMEKLQ